MPDRKWLYDRRGNRAQRSMVQSASYISFSCIIDADLRRFLFRFRSATSRSSSRIDKQLPRERADGAWCLCVIGLITAKGAGDLWMCELANWFGIGRSWITGESEPWLVNYFDPVPLRLAIIVLVLSARERFMPRSFSWFLILHCLELL